MLASSKRPLVLAPFWRLSAATHLSPTLAWGISFRALLEAGIHPVRSAELAGAGCSDHMATAAAVTVQPPCKSICKEVVAGCTQTFEKQGLAAALPNCSGLPTLGCLDWNDNTSITTTTNPVQDPTKAQAQPF